MIKLFFLLFLIVTSLESSAKDFWVMSYNVENLFDTTHDDGKDDFEYLPLNSSDKAIGCKKIRNKSQKTKCFNTDWNESAYQFKLNQTAKAILEAPSKPAIIALVEIENENVIQDLIVKLKGQFKFFVTHSPDKRGVDVAILYDEKLGDFKFISSKEFEIEELRYFNKKTRNILALTLELKNSKKITMLVNHWPSQGGPVGTRMMAAKKLKSITQEFTSLKHTVLAMGDFNIVQKENSDIEQALGLNISWIKVKALNGETNGTYFYAKKKEWSFFDRFYLSNDQSLVDIGSAVILNSEKLSEQFDSKKYRGQTPKRFNIEEKNGFSDHYPILIKIKN